MRGIITARYPFTYLFKGYISMEDLEFSDYELKQEDDIILDIETDSYLDDPRRGQAYYINRGDY
jgi:hypothetical protein